MKNLKVVFMGTPAFAAPTLNTLIINFNVIAVITQPDKLGHRGKLTSSPIKQLALDNEIKLFQPEKIREDYADIVALKPDLIVTCAYGQIIPLALLQLPKYACLNVHASLLPKLRGGAPINRSIINGDKKTGITIMHMDEKMDEGNIISQSEVAILDEDTVGTIHDKLSTMGASLLLETLPSIIDGTAPSLAQDHSQATYAYNLTKEDELVDFNQTSTDVFNQIRGLNPFPGAYGTLDGKVIKFYDLEKSNIKSSEAGKINNITDEGLYVSCLDYDIIIKEIKPQGTRKMTVKDFFNGHEKSDFLNKKFNEE